MLEPAGERLDSNQQDSSPRPVQKIALLNQKQNGIWAERGFVDFHLKAGLLVVSRARILGMSAFTLGYIRAMAATGR